MRLSCQWVQAAGRVTAVTETMSGSSEIKRLVITLSSLSLTTSTLENKHLMKTITTCGSFIRQFTEDGPTINIPIFWATEG